MRNVLETVEKVLDRDAPILILGESGSGKDSLAEAIHACSQRRDLPFVHIECAAIPPDLFESELFGYEKGTFTDAQARKLGKLELGQGGTVYFDDISSLSPALQAKLLRALQEKSFTRLGGHQAIAFEARVISSSSSNLEAMLATGEFRRDLFYRINVVTVTLPSLRQRPEDIPLLASEFAGRRRKIDPEAMVLLQSHAWPGNIRELRNTIERALLVSDGQSLSAESLGLAPQEMVAAAARGRWTLDQLEETYIREVLRETRSNYSRAAEILGINRKTLLEKRKKYGIDS
jgi:transcriptional regulator with PAS, ATPase and Fis domain